MGNNFKYFVYGIIGLAAIGLLYNLFFNTVSFFKSILMMVGFAVILGFVIYYFLIGRHKSSVSSGYRKAVKQSRKKYGKANSTYSSNTSKPGKIQRHSKKASHLTVIKGNKK
ncbi:SA1362 family protein [Aquisalibacillus elongatus]|uniref:Zinc ribbon protein n=1 Tax=Aquisalibacillus elongatus TaxID=485577 RepID=A0A3N5BK66_9BACI|nr:SA1362 family protein [Aquisalibacillus elongatus]RPF55650.1 zinc ribbon protein [Aquisalibacillus elongatus]